MHVCRYCLDLMQGVTTLYVVEFWEMADDEGGKPHKQADCT
jgi:hypothetical protein